MTAPPDDLQAPGDALPLPHPHCYWLLPGRVLAGEHPAAHLDRLEAAGVTHFVDLTEQQRYTPRRARHHAHPITDFGIPTDAGMRATLATIEAALAQGEMVYLHCQAGIGRTGTVAACLLVERGAKPDEALAVLAHKFKANAKSAWVSRTPETEAQRAFVLRWGADRG